MDYSVKVLLLSTVVSLLGGLIFGYELGIISGALLQLQMDFHLGCHRQEVLVSALLIGALLASLVGGLFIDHYGRRISILSSNVVLLAGSLILILPGSFVWLVIGRIIVGFAISISSMACCIYVSEIVHPHRRGVLVSLYESGITVGILLSYALNYFLSEMQEGWKYMFGLAIAPAAVQFFNILFLPSNPPKLNTVDEETQNSLIQMQNIDEIEECKSDRDQERQYSFIDLFRSRDNMRIRTLVGLGLVLFQQLTGQPNILYYASTIFRSLGFQSDSSAMLAPVGLGAVKVVSTLVAMGCADKAGRRILLMAGCTIMAISITAIGVINFVISMESHDRCNSVSESNISLLVANMSGEFTTLHLPVPHITLPLHEWSNPTSRTVGVNVSQSASIDFNSTGSPKLATLSSYTETVIFLSKGIESQITQPSVNHVLLRDHTALNWITLLSMMAFVSAFSIGFGPMTWLVLSEIYPAGIRGRAFAFCNSFNWGANLIISLSFLDVIDLIGLSWTFLLFGFMGVAAVLFIYLYIPETKGLSLEEIDKQFASKRFFTGNKMRRRSRRREFPEAEYQRMDISSAP